MSFNFSAAYPTGPTATSPVGKGVNVRAVKLSSSDFTTTGAASVKAVLPPDASIIGFRVWTKTALSGGGITAASLSIGVSGTATKYVNAASLTNTSGAMALVASASNIFQDQGVETGDVSLLFTGTATTGNPSAGEVYVLIEYVR